MSPSHYFYIIWIFLEVIDTTKSRPHDMNFRLASNFQKFNVTVLEKTDNNTSGVDNLKPKRRILIRSLQGDDPPSYKEGDIIFPDSLEEHSDPARQIDITPNCASKDTFCESVESYPYRYVDAILHKLSPRSRFFFGVDEEPSDLTERLDSSTEETFICRSIPRMIFPKIAKNKDDQWKYVLNQDKTGGFVQGVRVETCRNVGRPCDLLEFPHGYTASCKQKYIYRRMLSLSEEGIPMPDTFQLPSACCCSYKRDLDFLARLGDQITPVRS